MKKITSLFLCSLAALLLHGAEAEPWTGNTLGLDHSVPPPFERVSNSGATVQIWGREFTLNGAALPMRVVSQQEEMLTDAITLSYENGDDVVVLAPSKNAPAVVEQYDDYIVFRGSASAPGIEVSVQTWLWFDGLTRFQVKTSSPDELEVKRFSLNVPLNPESLTLNYQRPFYGYAPHVLRDMWGTIDGKRNFPFLTNFHLSGRNTSFAWLAEYPQDWYLQRKSQALQVIGGDDEYLFKVNFIDAYGQTRVGGRELDFSILWGPVRPPRHESRRYHEIWWEAEPGELLSISPEMRPCVLVYPFSLEGEAYKQHKGTPYGRAGRKSFGMPDPENPQGFKEWVKQAQGARGLVCPYINADNFNPLDPDGKKHLTEWGGAVIPETFTQAEDGFSPLYGFAACFSSRDWADYFVWKAKELFTEYHFDGYYVDNCAPRVCTNPAHGACESYVDELGKKWSKNPFHASRELYLRLFRIIRAIDPEAVFFVNGGSVYPFWDFVMSSEAVGNVGGYWSDVVKPEELEGNLILSSRQLGPGMFVYSTRDDTPEKTRDLIGLAVINDTTSCWYVNSTEWKKIADNVIVPYQLWNAEFIPFWSNSPMVSTTDKNVYPTVYRCADNARAVIFLSDPWGEDNEITVTVNPGELFPGYTGKIVVENVETKAIIPSTLRMVLERKYEDFKVKVKRRDFVIISVSKEMGK